MERFVIAEGVHESRVENFIRDNRKNFYSKSLEEFIEGLPSVNTGIHKTGIYRNDKYKQWEYWAVIENEVPPQQRLGMPTQMIFSICNYSVEVLGFCKWLEDISENGEEEPPKPTDIIH